MENDSNAYNILSAVGQGSPRNAAHPRSIFEQVKNREPMRPLLALPEYDAEPRSPWQELAHMERSSSTSESVVAFSARSNQRSRVFVSVQDRMRCRASSPT